MRQLQQFWLSGAHDSRPSTRTSTIEGILPELVPRVGRHRFVLLANGEELAQKALFIGPTEAFR